MGRVIGLLFPKVDDEPFKEIKEEIKEEKQAPKKKSTRKPKEEKED